MIKTITEPVPERMRTVQVCIVCDNCHKESPRPDSWAAASIYDIDQIEIKHNVGSMYPEGGSGEEWIVDLCPDCFNDLIVEHLKARHITGRIREWDT